MSTLLRDVIEIPQRAGAEDYVLRLTDSVSPKQVERTLAEYVVTPSLSDAFDTALGLVADAITTGTSRGAFLRGSFGAGKSHFMAVLHAVLRREPTARGKAELQAVIGSHDPVLEGKRVLPLAFHLLGAESLEEALFSGYLRQIAALHPGAPLPAVNQADQLFADADNLRQTLGDERFFASLSGNADDKYSALLGPGSWDAETYAQARAADPKSSERQDLVSALVETFFKSYVRQAAWVDLDSGLAAIARHAKGLGYDAVVLFLDELVLWLAFGVQDLEFFRREAPKLTELVEAGVGNRAIPLVSFVARQMDLRRWFADAGASGAEQDALDRAFRHQDGRFAAIQLGDDNLPFVAQQRLLRPRTPEARRVLEDAFGRLDRRPAVWDVLLDGVNTDEQHRGADEQAFRQTYPFSPALVSTLRSLASVMQRERTALKVMQQMLVDRRDSLTVDDVLPVGDAFEYIVQGHTGQALDQKAAALFRSASALYAEKLRPLLLPRYNLTEADLAAGAEKPPALVADERLAQTLLLSAVAPNVPALKGLTASRLASLNHGSIATPLPGNEATMVTGKVRDWSKQVPEIHIEPDVRNPIIRVQLSDVDYESIVEKAKGEDNEGRRRELIKALVASSLGVELGPEDVRGAHPYPYVWRGSRREVDLVFGNVRDAGWLTDDAFVARDRTWRVVIDHPFDEPGHSSAEDRERLHSLIANNPPTSTVVWLPHFFSPERMQDVRRLVILNWLLEGSGDRWASHADHLSETDRVQARAILESQRSSLRHAVERAIQVAYDAAAPTASPDVVSDVNEQVLTSLDQAFNPQRPVGATLAAAFDNLLRQAFDAKFPAHPRFEPPEEEIRVRDLRATLDHVQRAMADRDGRVLLQGPDVRSVRRVANALGVGRAAETHFLFGDDRFDPWNAQFERELGRRADQDAPVSVREVRGWIEAMTPANGLRDEVKDLVVLAWAALRRRAWFGYGAPIPAPEPGALRPEMEMRVQPMPDPDQWDRANLRAGHLFGFGSRQFLTPQAVAELAQEVKDAVQALYQDAFALVAALETAYAQLGLSLEVTRGRLATARAAAQLTQLLRPLDGVELVQRLAAVDLTGEDVLGRSLKSAGTVGSALGAFRWDRLQPLHEAAQGEDVRAEEAASILEALRRQLEHDEFEAAIATALTNAENDLFRWLTPPPPPPRTPHRQESHVLRENAGQCRLAAGESPAAVLAELREFRELHGDRPVVVEWRVVG